MSYNFNNQNQNDFPSLGGQQNNQGPNQQQQFQQQQWQQNQYNQQPQQQQFYGNQFQNQQQFGGFQQNQFVAPQQQQQPQFQNNFPSFSAPAADTSSQATAAASDAGGDNPFSANPFGGASTSSFTPKEFKPKGAIDLGDDPGFGGLEEVGKSKKKKKDVKALQQEAQKKKEEEEARKPTKGKPSSFFVMPVDPNSNVDPYGGQRVPTQEQRVFIYTHYPMNSQEPQMIAKIYELWQFANNEEQEAEMYKRQKVQKNQDAVDVDKLGEEVVAGGSMGGGGMGGAAKQKPVANQNKAAARKNLEKQKEEKTKKAALKKAAADVGKDSEAEERKRLAALSAKVKDVDPASLLNEEIVEINEALEPASLVFIGHVDAGKSTICGQIVYQMGLVDDRTIQQFKEEAKKYNRDSWWLAYIMDNSEEEKEKGKTVDIGRTVFETKNKMFTIIDAPGHKNYVPNMIQGVGQADYAGLVISARKGEFEAGFEKDGQTREHIQLVKSLGVQKLVIIVNKMDEASVKWNKKRFDDIQGSLTPFLHSTGFKDSDLEWIPISGINGDNITEVSDACNWYNGKPLMDIFDSLPIEVRDPTAPLRFPVLDKTKEANKIAVFGKVEQGTLRLGDKLALSPYNLPCQVLQIENFKDEQVKFARPGDAVKVKLSNVGEDNVNKGDVLCPRDYHMFSSQILLAELDLLELRIPVLTKGSIYMMHIHTFSDLVVIQTIEWAIETDNAGNEVRKEKPSMTKSGSKCMVRIQLKAPIPVEKESDLPALGRFTLRDEGKTIALGRVNKFVPYNKENLKRVNLPGQAKSAADGKTVDKSKNEVFDAETGKTVEKKPDLGAIAEEDQ